MKAIYPSELVPATRGFSLDAPDDCLAKAQTAIEKQQHRDAINHLGQAAIHMMTEIRAQRQRKKASDSSVNL